MEDLFKQIEPYMKYIEGALVAIGILIIGWVASRVARSATARATEKAKLDVALGRFLGSLVRYAVLAAAFIAALDSVGIQTTSLIAVFGAAGLAVGLALQGSLSNFASGVMILFFRPFGIGDVIVAAGQTAKVADIGIFFTTMMTPDNQKVIVPNSAITSGVITNVTAQGTRRAEVAVGVAYGADVEVVSALLLKAATANDLVLDDPEPAIVFADLGASSLDFVIRVWVNAGDWFAVQALIRKEVYDRLNEAKIDIPYNQIVVHQAA